MVRGYVISDLHMFSKRSSYEQNRKLLETAMADARFFVLNGDIFDFRWSRHGSSEATAIAAIEVLKQFTASYPQCLFYFVLGNHDSVSPFVSCLEDAARDWPNFAWDPHYVQLGKKLFIHGDAAHAGGELERLVRYRKNFEESRARGPLLEAAYEIATVLRLHRTLSYSVPKKQTIKNILRFLEHLTPGVTGTLTDIYFGHTHLPFTDYQYKHWTFHNTGAMIRGIPFYLLELEVAEESLWTKTIKK